MPCLLKQNINSSDLVVIAAIHHQFSYSDTDVNFLGTADIPIQLLRFPRFHTHLMMFKILGMIPNIRKTPILTQFTNFPGSHN